MRCAYLRATMASTPKVLATALQPPSTARRTIFSGSKYSGFFANEAPGTVFNALVNRKNGKISGTGKSAVIKKLLQTAKRLQISV